MVHGTLVFHKKKPGEEVRASNVHASVCGECSMGVCSLYTLCWVSLIAGVGFKVE